MGASEWFICTALQSEPRLALRAAQEQLLFQVRQRQPGRQVTIDSLRNEAGEDGTGSILDIFEVSDEPEWGVVIPADEELLSEAFGTTEPSRDLVDENWQQLAGLLDRWDAVYFPVYGDGTPREWCFVGCTGDGGDVLASAHSPSGPPVDDTPPPSNGSADPSPAGGPKKAAKLRLVR